MTTRLVLVSRHLRLVAVLESDDTDRPRLPPVQNPEHGATCLCATCRHEVEIALR